MSSGSVATRATQLHDYATVMYSHAVMTHDPSSAKDHACPGTPVRL
jgi:hypothetical protein